MTAFEFDHRPPPVSQKQHGRRGGPTLCKKREGGLIAQKTGDWNHAIYYFARLVAVEPSDVGYLLLSHALYQGKRNQEAKLSYQQALRFSTDINQAQQRASQLMAE